MGKEVSLRRLEWVHKLDVRKSCEIGVVAVDDEAVVGGESGDVRIGGQVAACVGCGEHRLQIVPMGFGWCGQF